MSLLPMLSDEIQTTIDELGLPIPVVDDNDRVLMLMEPVFAPDPLGGFSVRIPGIAAVGGGDTKEEAALALREALLARMRAFGDDTQQDEDEPG